MGLQFFWITLIMVATGLALYLSISTVFRREKIEDMSNFAREKALTLHNSMKVYSRLVELSGSREEVIDFMKREDRQPQEERVLNYLKRSSTISEMLAYYLMDRNGRVWASTDPRFLEQDYSFRNYFKQALAGEAFSEAALGVTSGETGYYFSGPIKDEEGKIIGVSTIKVSTGTFLALVGGNFSDAVLDQFIADEDGVVLTSNKENRTLRPLGTLSEETLARLEKENYTGIRDAEPLDY